MDGFAAGANTGSMAKRKYNPTFIRAWREHRSLTLEQLAENIGGSAANLSRLEKGIQPYNQEILEKIASALRCSPADLIVTDPQTQGIAVDILALMSRIPISRQRQLLRAVQALTDDETAA